VIGLVAIAIPTFLGARTRARDRAAQSSLRNAFSTGVHTVAVTTFGMYYAARWAFPDAVLAR
jgi:stress-induced morphogen